MIAVSRRELKYMMSYTSGLKLQSELNQILQIDEHANRGCYNVRSLYFDSINNIDFFEKIDGDERRKKIRLRIYNSSQNTAKYESSVESVRQKGHKIPLPMKRGFSYRIRYGKIYYSNPF